MLSSLRVFVVCAIALGIGLVCGLWASPDVFSASQFLGFAAGQRTEPLAGDGRDDRGLHIDSLDLGVVETGGKRTAITWLRNTSAQPVALQRIVTSCDCLSVEIANRELAPGEAVPVRIDFDDSKDPGFTGSLSVEIRSLDGHGEQMPLGTIDLEISADARIRSLLGQSTLNRASIVQEPF
jgi:hypothetical protein